MKVKEIFAPMGLSQSFGGLTEFLNHNNCIVVNKTKQESAILLHMHREVDGTDGHAYMRVRKEYGEIQEQLLQWAFGEPSILCLTIHELSELETNLSISSIGGRLQVSSV